MMRNIGLKLLVLACFLLPVITASAQCPMCKLSAETSDIRAGLNTGILYLLAAPFLLVGGAYGYWYLNRKQFENH
jgi:hypothetical protein